MDLTLTKARSYLVLSDVHLGARQTTASEILEHLDTFFYRFQKPTPYDHLDVLFIAGDLWDDTIEFSSDVIHLFIEWFHRLLRWCHVNKIKLRILEGTPRHDRKQSATIERLGRALVPDLDFKYVSTLSIEKMEDLGMSVLYVPDECRHTAEIVDRDVDQLLAESGLTQVDIAIMHGMFKYQLGTIPMNNKVYDEATWLGKVKHYLSIGHIHTYSQYSRIIAQGSFDRLRHGEEEAKGAVLFQENGTGEWVPLFLENKLAKIYKTVKVKGTLEKALDQLHRAIKKLPSGSHVRIQAEPGHAIFQGLDTLKRQYLDFTFTKKVDDVKTEVAESSAPSIYRQISLNRDTLTAAVMDEVTRTEMLSDQENALLRLTLEDLHNP